MAKTNWVLNEIVMPADMNQIGTEINAKAEKHDTLLTGVTSLERRNLIRISENKRTLGNSPNQKLNLTLPALVASGVLRVSVYGAYNINDDNGIISKDFSFVSNTSNIISINQEYSEILGNARNSFRISDIDVANRVIRIAYTPNVSVGQGVNIKLEMFVSSRDEAAIVTSNQFFRNITIGEFYQDSVVLPIPVVQKRQLELTAPQGTAPLIVSSTTKVENLNVGMVNGFSFFNSFAQLGLTNTPTMQQVLNAMPDLSYLKVGINLLSSTGLGLPSNVEGTLEVSRIYTSRTFAEFNEFNGDKYTAKINSTSIFSAWNKLLNQGGPISGTQLTSTATQGTAPLAVTSNTKVDNLNSDLVDGFHASQNKDVNTVAVRRADGSIQLGGFSEFEQIGIKLPGRNRELRITQDANNITYIQLVDQNGGFIANPIQVNANGTAGLNASTNVISYTDPNTPQVRNTHVGNTAPSNSLGINGDMYIEV